MKSFNRQQVIRHEEEHNTQSIESDARLFIYSVVEIEHTRVQ
jgi:hypothetical protein